MEGIQFAVREVFPSVEKELFDQLLERVKQLGAETTEDMKYLEAQDFAGILKPIQARKFLEKVVQPKAKDSSTTRQSATRCELQRSEECKMVEDLSASESPSTSSSPSTPKSSGSSTSAGPETSSSPSAIHESGTMMNVNNIPVDMVGKPWPSVYVFPRESLRLDIRERLDAGEGKQDRRIKKAVITALFDDLMAYKTYPTSEMYVAAAKSVIQCYPFLKDTNPCSNPYDSWKLALSEKFRNERRNMQLPSVVKRKRVAQTGPVPKRPVKNWTSSRPIGEDDISIGRHKEWMQTEMKKSRNMNQEKVDHLMQLTFADRRKMITENCPIRDVRKEFPALFQVEQMHAEFSLLMGEDLENGFITRMKPIFEKVVKWSFSRKEDREIVTKALELRKGDMESDAVLVAGSFLLPRLLLESPKDLFVKGGTEYSEAAPIPSTPVIVYSGDLFETSSFSIMVENEEICQPLSSYTSLYSLMATFYCFNLAYPPKMKRTLEFLQKVGLSLYDDGKLSPRVASVYAKLKA